MPSSWQAQGQLQFLKGRVQEFKTAQKARKGMKKFYKTVFTDFFVLYPNPESEVYDPPAIKLTKKGKVSKRQPCTEQREVKKFETVELWMRDRERKIRAWFYNHTATGRRGKARLKLNINVGSTSRPRVLSEANLYSKSYYNTRVKSKVDAELKGVDDPDMRIAITKRCLHESWNAETSAVKSEIRELRRKLLKERKAAEELVERIFSGEQNPDDMEPEEYLLAQESIDEIIDEILDLIATRTGWAVSLNIGGPDMSKMNGEIIVKTYHVGNPKGKVTFWTETPNYDEMYAKPFRNWCREFFSESTRLRRAVHIDERKVKDPQALVEAGRGHGHLVYVHAPDTPEEIAAREHRIAEEKIIIEAEKTGGKAAASDGTGDALRGDDGDDKGPEGVEDVKVDDGEEEEGGIDEMTWVHTNDGVPVPVFITKGASSTRAPERTSSVPNVPDVQQNPIQPLPSNTSTGPNPHHTPQYQAKPFNNTPNPDSVPTMDQWTWNDTFAHLGSGFLDGGATLNGGGWGGTAEGGGMGAGFVPPPSMNYLPKYNEQNGQALGLAYGQGLQGTMGIGGGAGVWNWTGDVMGAAGAGAGATLGAAGAQPMTSHELTLHGMLEVAESHGHEVGMGGGNSMSNVNTGRNTGGALPGDASVGTLGGGGTVLNVNTGGNTGSALPGDAGGGALGGGATVNANTGGNKGSAPSGGASGGIPGGGRAMSNVGNAGSAVLGGMGGGIPGGGSVIVNVEKRKQGDEVDTPAAGGQRTKRLRQAPAAIELPEWIDSAYGHLNLGMTHELWLKVVEMWYQFERSWASKGMSQSGRMPTSKRPTELGTWLPAPRQYNTIPKLENVHAFADQWVQWWAGIQPECRRAGADKLPKPLTKNMNISSLKKGGGLGLIVVLIGLRWWGDCAELGDRWEQAVEDMEAVFRRFQEGSV